MSGPAIEQVDETAHGVTVKTTLSNIDHKLMFTKVADGIAFPTSMLQDGESNPLMKQDIPPPILETLETEFGLEIIRR